MVRRTTVSETTPAPGAPAAPALAPDVSPALAPEAALVAAHPQTPEQSPAEEAPTPAVQLEAPFPLKHKPRVVRRSPSRGSRLAADEPAAAELGAFTAELTTPAFASALPAASLPTPAITPPSPNASVCLLLAAGGFESGANRTERRRVVFVGESAAVREQRRVARRRRTSDGGVGVGGKRTARSDQNMDRPRPTASSGDMVTERERGERDGGEERDVDDDAAREGKGELGDAAAGEASGSLR